MSKVTRPRLHPHPPTTGRTSEIVAAAPETVLLVEDDPLIARTVQRHLRVNGFEVVKAARPSEVLNMNSKFSLGVFDIDLPEQNGVELARLCLDRGLVKRAIFYSAVADGDLREMAENLGEFIEKQSGISTLLQHVIQSYKESKPRKRLIAVG